MLLTIRLQARPGLRVCWQSNIIAPACLSRAVSHHMRSPLPILIAVALALVGCSPPGKGPLSFQSPAGWKAEHQTPGGLHFYKVTAGTPDGGLLMFSQWPPLSKPEEIPALVRQIADGFLKQAQQASEFTLASREYRIEQFAGAQCQGSYAVFQAVTGGTNVLQSMFMMSVDGRVWNGQFTGPSNAWTQAITVLRSVRKNG
jgi:hypothetical protein